MVNGLSYSIIVISVVAMTITSITLVGMASDGYYKEWKVYFGRFIPIWIILFIIGSAIPSQKTLLMVGASEVTQRVMNSDKLNSVVDPSLDYIKTWLITETQKMTSINDKEKK